MFIRIREEDPSNFILIDFECLAHNRGLINYDLAVFKKKKKSTGTAFKVQKEKDKIPYLARCQTRSQKPNNQNANSVN